MRFPFLLFVLSTASVSGFHVSQPVRSKPPSSSCLYAANEIATLGSLGPLDFALFLVPVGALVVRASAINDRNELQLEIETSQKFLEDAKQRLVKVEEAIKVRKSRVEALEIIAKLSSLAGVLSFAFVLAFQLGVFAPPEPEAVIATAESVSTTVVKEVAKSEPKVEPKVEVKTEPKSEEKVVVVSKEDSKLGDDTKTKKEEKVEEVDKKEVVVKEEKPVVKDTSSLNTNDNEKKDADETAAAPYEDLMKKIEEPKSEAKEAEELIEEQKIKEEQKAKEFVELEGGML